MANWITHTIVAERVLQKNSWLDERGFCIGNIAPDCNVENEDWTAFIPSREKTHFMSASSKLSADVEAFCQQYIKGRNIISSEEYSFLIGYAAHLLTDIAYQKMIRNPQRIQDMFERIKKHKALISQIEGMPETFDTIKKVFGKQRIFADIAELEHNYILMHNHTLYLEVLKKTDHFPEYLDFFPKGAIVRKIKRMAYEVTGSIQDNEKVFFTREEYKDFIDEAVEQTEQVIQKLHHSAGV